MQPIFVLFILVSVLWLIVSVFRLKKRHALAPFPVIAGYGLIPGLALLLIVLAENQVLPSSQFLVGALLIIGVGVTFIIWGVTEKVDLHEWSMKMRLKLIDRKLFEVFGRRYFYLRSIVLGVFFILAGALLILRKVF